jgi:geranylgeranyl pyrophosphate synthase
MYCMNKELVINADACYKLSEQKAEHYFQALYNEVMQKSYVPTLTIDVQSWKQNHIHNHPWITFFFRRKGKTGPQGYQNYIHWLDYTGKLDHYLDRSISYIFMRDLGKDLHSPAVRARVQRVVASLKSYLKTDKGNNSDPYSLAGLYRMAQKEHIESTMIWLIKKLKIVSSHIPEGMDAVHAQRKLIKIIGGVLMHVLEGLEDGISQKERTRLLDEAIRLGYSYGLTYPFIDDLLDAKVLSDEEKRKYSNLIRTTLTTGFVPKLGDWEPQTTDLLKFVHSELREAFEYIKSHQRPETVKSFLEQAYVFFNSQEIDRIKELSNEHYTNEELYIPIILKSSSSRLIVRSVISAEEDEGFDDRTFYYGIYNQLADDFADMFDDMRDGAVTPYTYYLKYHEKRKDLINPFELYWTVISYLIHNVYHSDPKACEVILDRAINGLKRFKARMGTEKYNQVMKLFFSESPNFKQIIQSLVDKADDVDFFDKLLRDHIITILKNERMEQEDFLHTVETVRNQINRLLIIPKIENESLVESPIIDAANYSLNGDGKRLRPIITWVMGVNVYGLKSSALVPLLRSLEFMHTASLIFDDLPSQDNAPTRRGRPTLHQTYNIAVAELTGLFLTQKATEEQASLSGFDPKTVLKLIQYSSQTTEMMCKGQAMDLESKGKKLTLEQLNTLSFYKTGIAFEASLIMPAILAQATEIEIGALKTFALHAGIAFQIKDDLLDVEGDPALLGKPIGIDGKNNNSTFVSILGRERASKVMWEHYCLAMETMLGIEQNTTFLKHLLNYIVNRDH